MLRQDLHAFRFAWLLALTLLALRLCASYIGPVLRFSMPLLPRLWPLLLHSRSAQLRQYLQGLGSPCRFAFAWRALFMLKISAVLRGTVLRPGLGMHLLAWHGPLVMALAYHMVTRLVMVMLVTDHPLVFALRITLAVIVPLVHRQGCRGVHHAAVPVIPAMVITRPAWAPVQVPARRRADHPAMEVHRRRDVVTYRNTQIGRASCRERV